MKRTLSATALGIAAALALAACGGGSSNPLSTGGGSASGGGVPSGSAKAGTIRVGAANFPESQLIAEIYAAALNAKGIKATTGDPIGAREVYLKALQQGSIDLVPEYAYSLLTFYNPSASQTEPDAVRSALTKKLPSGDIVLDSAPAEDSNTVTVTKETAAKWKLKTIGDLAKHSKEVTFAAPAEFQSREQGLKGLKKKYNLVPKSFRALQGTAIVQALKNDQAQAANIFTTDPSIKADGFVILKDPKHVFGSDNVVPLIRKAKASTKVQTVINAVQAKLTTDKLAAMDKKVQVDHKDASSVAKQFISSNGLG
ncbi:glycine/betaine ABC transporter substrate-binding protein [Flexivirga endophytica]|uniref:Glycine/betaine ABC transporter substrate-binding protein n=1 Tax=Flexivirga endophytica TaxID=1849103 RepID=A0A916WT06_9MICO|nr:ABC transporter substrate-binding protein [Flexivirga endophytica]GGB30042.1 glycine/betaine ABC transporter substrate-binding protein [Flexivirga endophytica]GHB50978.1 glycine/betaine ABC transporter substrate-binding protein [Flexivirga endophytica]